MAGTLSEGIRGYGRTVARLARDAKFVFRVLKHPSAPWSARVVAACSTAYLVSPIQLIPSFIPVIGQLDDVLVLYLGMKFINAVTPDPVRAECSHPDCASSKRGGSVLPSVLGLQPENPRI